ncbi:MAG: Smr/MutS family protein [bacterium]|nr:Smr/MutS family protein [bacterium]
MGVRRLDRSAAESTGTDPSAGDERLFLEAMRELEAAPDKDQRPTQQPTLRKLRLSKKTTPKPEDSLDLHGKTTEEALSDLARFVAQAAAGKKKTVVVITGKGLHSHDGVGVLRQEVERWIRRRGKRFVRAFSEAPRALGGKGAYILYLRPP